MDKSAAGPDSKTEYRITQRDYVRATMLFQRRTAKGNVLLVSAIVLLLAGAFIGGALWRSLSIGGLAGIITVVLAQWLITPLWARRHYRQYKAIQESVWISQGDDGVELASESGTARITWDKIHKWRQNQDYLLIYPMPRLFYPIPKTVRASGFDLAGLIARLGENVGKEK